MADVSGPLLCFISRLPASGCLLTGTCLDAWLQLLEHLRPHDCSRAAAGQRAAVVSWRPSCDAVQ